VDIIRDVRSADNLREKFFYVFGDPGDIGAYKKQKELKQQAGQTTQPPKKEATIIEMEPQVNSNGELPRTESKFKNAVGE
jgi:hypothetical protein